MAKTAYNISVEYDSDTDIITIEGIHYAGEFFRKMALAQPGTWLRVERKRNGAINLFSPHDETAKLFDVMTAKL